MKRASFLTVEFLIAVALVMIIDSTFFYRKLVEDIAVGAVIGCAFGYLTRAHKKGRIRK